MVQTMFRKVFVMVAAVFLGAAALVLAVPAKASAGEYKWIHSGGPLEFCEDAVLNGAPLVLEVTAIAGEIDPTDLKLFFNFADGSQIAGDKVDPNRFTPVKDLKSLPVSFSGLRVSADAQLAAEVVQGIDCPKPPSAEFRGLECIEGAASIVVFLDNSDGADKQLFDVFGRKGDGINYAFAVPAGETRTEYIGFEGDVRVTITATAGDFYLVVGPQKFSAGECRQPVDPKPKGTIGDVVCSANGAYALVTLRNPQNDLGEIGFEVATTSGYLKTFNLASGEVRKVRVPLAEGKKELVTVTALDAVIASAILEADCEKPVPPAPPTEPMLPNTGLGDTAHLAMYGGAAVLLGALLLFIARRRPVLTS